MKQGFRGQVIYLVQSPPILGDLGGISRLKRIYEDLCVHGSQDRRGNPSKKYPSHKVYLLTKRALVQRPRRCLVNQARL